MFTHYGFFTQRALLDADPGILAGCRLPAVLSETPIDRLAAAVREVGVAAADRLVEPAWVASWVASAGLYTDDRDLYGPAWRSSTLPPGTVGTWQHPDELAGLLIHLAGRNVRSALEVGHFKGWTSALLASYLRRFGMTRFLGFDTADWGTEAVSVPGLEFCHGDRPPAGDWDFVLIDADHSYAAVRADWEYYRRRARLIAFHDVNDAAVRDTPGYDGGVWRLWREITQASAGRCFEFIRPDGLEAFGIGLVEV